MTEIKIKNSRLKLVKLDYKLGDTRITGLEKKKLKYQIVYFIDSKMSPTYRTAYGISSFTLDKNVKSYEEAWVIQKCEKNSESLEYDRYEVYVISSIIKCLYNNHLDTTELLCHALGDGILLNAFYSSFGKMIPFVTRLNKIIEEDVKLSITDKNYALQYQRSKYSIYDLLHDLVKERAKIYIGPDLVSYKRLTPGKTREYKSLFSWSNVTSILGNKERANLSLVSYTDVEVNIPENKFGIEPGKKTFPEFKVSCIIKDGLVWTREIGVRISKKLVKKLYPTGVIATDLVFEGEYLLDLSKLPVISKKHLKVTRFNLAKAEIKSKLLGYTITYKTLVDQMKKYGLKIAPKRIKKEEKTEATKFLESLGIYKGYYNKWCKYIKKATTYETIPVVSSTIPSLPENSGDQISYFINTGKCANKLLEEYLKSLDLNNIDLEKTEKEKDKVDKEIRDMKFRLILGKHLQFNEPKKPRIQSKLNTSAPIVGDKSIIVQWENTSKKIESL